MALSSKAFVFAKEEEIEDLGGGIKRQILGYENSILLAKVWFEEGAMGYAHRHPHAQVSHVLSGEFRVLIDGEEKILCAGDSFYAAPDCEHGATCLREGALLDCFSPVREDFLRR